MLDVLEVQDKLKNFSQEQLLREMQMPSGSVPQFLVLSELNRRRTMSQDMEKQKMADQPTVKEEVVAASGMPMPETSMLAQQMAPQTSMAENTGIAAMMPKELPSEEEPMKMSYGGVLNSRAMVMAQPLRSSPPLALPFPPRMQQQRDNLGFNNLGSNIVDRIGEKSQGEVDEFIGEVRDMADERFDLDLNQQPQFDTGGKGFSPLLSSAQQANRGTPISSSMMYRKEGGPIKAQSGMFAQMMPKFPTPPAFATIYNYAKTVLGLDDELARDVATKTLEQGEIDKSQLGMFSAKPFGSVEERLSGDDRLAQRKALDTFTGGAEMNQLVDQLSKPTTDIGGVQDVQAIPDMTPAIDSEFGGFSTPTEVDTSKRDKFKKDQLEYLKFLERSNPRSSLGSIIDSVPTSSSSIDPSITDLEAEYGSTFPLKNIKKTRRSGVKADLAKNIRDLFKLPDTIPDKNIRGGKFRSPTKEVFPEPESFPQTGTLGVTASEAEEQAKKAEEYQTALKTFSGGEEVDKLVDTLQKDQKKKQEEQEAAKTDSAGALGGFGATSGALSELEAEIDKLRAKREKGRESDKWFALAEVGLGMLASQSPTLAGALGEGGLKGLKSFREGKKEYDKDMLGYLTTKASIQKTRGELGLRKLGIQKQLEALKNKGAKGTYGIKEAKDDLNNTNQRIAKLLELSTDPQRQIGTDSESKAEIDRQLKNLLAEKAAAEVYLRSIGANVPFSFTGNQTTVPNLADK